MKITFLLPPPLDNKRAVDRCYGCNYGLYFLPHLPILYLATILKQNDFDIEIHDMATHGKSIEYFYNFIKKDDSDIYVFYTVFLSEETDILARNYIRKVKKNIKFIFCGTQPTWLPENFLDTEDTFVIRGEPDFVIRDLLLGIRENGEIEKIKGISYKKNDRCFHNESYGLIENLDDLPIPDRTLLDHSVYYRPQMRKMPHTGIITSRGCYAKCTFCVPNSLAFARELEYKKYFHHKPVPRLHSVERVLEEFRLIANLGFKSVSIMDDEFLWNEERDLQIIKGIKQLNLEWSCLARADRITEPIAKAMAESDCVYVDIGVESFNQKILDSIGKCIKVENISRGIKILKKYNIEPELNILLGASSLETEETIKDTIKKVEELDINYVLFNIACPFPGTEFYYQAKQNKWFNNKENDYVPIDPSEESLISFPHLSREKLNSLLSYAYKTHYFNTKYILNQLKKVQSPRDFYNKFVTGMRTFKRNILKKQ